MVMQTLNLLDTHVGSIDDGIQLINRFHWFLSVERVTVIEGGIPYWYVKGGESVIFSADTREAVDAFLYGMSLAYAVIPPPLFDRLVEATNDFE
jgi:hypothetical protein